MSVRIPSLNLKFGDQGEMPNPAALQQTLQRATGLALEFAVAHIDKTTFEQAAAHSPLDLNWSLGEDGYFDRIAIAHEDFAASTRVSLTPVYQSARLDVPVFRDYLWWMVLKALFDHGARDLRQPIVLPAWTAYRWNDEALPPAIKHLRELHEEKFAAITGMMENPDFKDLPEETLNQQLESLEADVEARFYAKYGRP
jgi:hypothetical protein